MCRSIHTLYNSQPPATLEEIQAAARQYVRKISGYSKPSRVNETAFLQAVEEVSAASQKLLASLQTSAPPRPRQQLAGKRE